MYHYIRLLGKLLAHNCYKLYNISSTVLRFLMFMVRRAIRHFLLFGSYEIASWGEIRAYNYCDIKSDFTYRDNIVDGIVRVMQCAHKKWGRWFENTTLDCIYTGLRKFCEWYK